MSGEAFDLQEYLETNEGLIFEVFATGFEALRKWPQTRRIVALAELPTAEVDEALQALFPQAQRLTLLVERDDAPGILGTKITLADQEAPESNSERTYVLGGRTGEVEKVKPNPAEPWKIYQAIPLDVVSGLVNTINENLLSKATDSQTDAESHPLTLLRKAAAAVGQDPHTLVLEAKETSDHNCMLLADGNDEAGAAALAIEQPGETIELLAARRSNNQLRHIYYRRGAANSHASAMQQWSDFLSAVSPETTADLDIPTPEELKGLLAQLHGLNEAATDDGWRGSL